MTSDQVAKRAGITYRQLDYWTRTGRVPGATRLQAIGTGYPREWTPNETAFVVALAKLVRAGIRVDVAAAALARQVENLGGIEHVREVPLTSDVTVHMRPALVAVSS